MAYDLVKCRECGRAYGYPDPMNSGVSRDYCSLKCLQKNRPRPPMDVAGGTDQEILEINYKTVQAQRDELLERVKDLERKVATTQVYAFETKICEVFERLEAPNLPDLIELIKATGHQIDEQ